MKYQCDCGSTLKPIPTLLNGMKVGHATCRICMISGDWDDFVIKEVSA